MADLFLSLKTSIRFIDFLDIAFVALIVYRALLLIRGTRAMQMLTGLGILIVGFFLSFQFQFFMTNWFLKHFFDYLVLIIIVLFQDDLRKALTHVGKNPFFAGRAEELEREMVEEVSKACVSLAKEHIGALIVIERETGLKNFIDTGSRLDARVKSELLFSIFIPESPIHDGAVIITEGRISAAGCFLPLSMEQNLDRQYGTRHRAALGLTEETDAVVILVSEETSQVHLARAGKMTLDLTESELKTSLASILDLSGQKKNMPKRLKSMFRTKVKAT